MEVMNTMVRRKTSVARIFMAPGKGNITINDKDLKVYFPSEILQTIVKQPLNTTATVGNFDVAINVDGGGLTGQAEALSRALCEVSAENRPSLKKEGFLTRDPRMVERKKYGRRKARRRFQFSKR